MNYNRSIELSDLTSNDMIQKCYAYDAFIPPSGAKKIYKCIGKGQVDDVESWDFPELVGLVEWCMVLKKSVRVNKSLIDVMISKIFDINSCYAALVIILNYRYKKYIICGDVANNDKVTLCRECIRVLFKTKPPLKDIPILIGAITCLNRTFSITALAECILCINQIENYEHIDLDILYGLFSKIGNYIYSLAYMGDVEDNETLYNANTVNRTEIVPDNASIGRATKELAAQAWKYASLKLRIIDYGDILSATERGRFSSEKFIGEDYDFHKIVGIYYDYTLIAYSVATIKNEEIKIHDIKSYIIGRKLEILALLLMLTVLEHQGTHYVIIPQNLVDEYPDISYFNLTQGGSDGKSIIIDNMHKKLGEFIPKNWDIERIDLNNFISKIFFDIFAIPFPLAINDIFGSYIKFASSEKIVNNKILAWRRFIKVSGVKNFNVKYDFNKIDLNKSNEFDSNIRNPKRMR
jgi:hypothetical protein